MLETARDWLAQLRAGADPQRFAYHETRDPDDSDSTCCAAAEARAQLLLALQYDHDPGDAALLRLLLAAEIDAHSHSDFQGLYEELHLAAWLVARLRDPADVFRMWSAKSANFDTQCGFDGQHLVAAGVAKTLAYLDAHDHPQRADIREYLADSDGECQFDEAQICDWHAAKARWFPAREADETPLTMLERALRFAPEEAPRWLEAWLAGEERNDRTLYQLGSYAVRLGDFDRAVAIAHELITRAGDGDASITTHQHLAGVLRKAGRLDDAEATLAQTAALAALHERSAWQQRLLLESWLNLAEAAAEAANATATTTANATAATTANATAATTALGRRAFTRADALLTAGFGHCHDNLRRLAACADALGEADAYQRLAAARDEEGAQIEAQMARLRAP